MFIEGIALFVLLLTLYHYWSLQYWQKKNIFSIRGEFLFGNIKDVILSKKSLIEMLSDLYDEHKSCGLVGFYSFYRPMLVVTDPDLVKDVLVKNFKRFSDNGYRIYSSADPMFGINPFCTTGLQNWKRIRGLHAPFHTSLQLKDMYPITRSVGKNMINYISEHSSKPLDVMQLTSYYTIENVTACAFGFEPKVFSDPENIFLKMTSSKLFTSSNLANLSALYCPTLAKILPLRIVSKEAEEFFVSMVKSSINTKLHSTSSRNDFIQFLMDYHQKQLDNGRRGLTDLEFAGHSVTFYLDGYETSASALSFTLLELANHPDVQEKLRNDILSVGCNIDAYDIEKVDSLSFLTMTINEALRMHPLLPVLSRECTETVQLGGRTIEKGTKVFIPVKCLHYDPQHYPDPHCFNPDRFSDDCNVKKCVFLPFGEGPRMCMGFRFALLQLKTALIHILLTFKVLPAQAEGKQEILEERTAPFVVIPKHGTKVLFHPLSNIK